MLTEIHFFSGREKGRRITISGIQTIRINKYKSFTERHYGYQIGVKSIVDTFNLSVYQQQQNLLPYFSFVFLFHL